MKKLLTLALTIALALTMLIPAGMAEEAETSVDTRPRTIVTTDLECDDIDSMIHFLLYANDIDIAGIVVSSSQHHWTGDGEHTMSEVISSYKQNGDLTEWRPMEVDWVENTLLNEYAEAYPNLVKHDSNYPTPGELVERTKIGNVEFEGDYRYETDGSNYIKECLLDDDPRTLYIQAWGGANTFARALLSIEEEYKDTEDWETIYRKVSDKVVFISWGDQDNAYPDYISKNWSEISRLYCVTSGIGYNISNTTTVPYRKYFKADWLTENIKFGHGSLMSKYLLFGDGTYYEGETDSNQFGYMSTLNSEDCWLSWFGGSDAFSRYDFISEGDSPCWMYLVPVGLRGLENSNYGSWGGRMAEQTDEDGNVTVSAVSEYDPTLGEMSSGYSVHRWFEAFMNDFAARADWCVSDYEDANHQPVVTAECLDFEAIPGETIELNGSATDPDGDALNYNWFVYTDACDYSGENAAYVDVWAHNASATSFTVPADAQEGDYFNIVLEVTDNGAPALTRYAQAIVTVKAAPAEEAAQ